MSFAYEDIITVTSNATLLPSTQTNFPVLYSVTDNSLKTVGNGGQVQNANGYDIRFFSDSGLSSAIPFELESYDGSAGTVVFWATPASTSLGLVYYSGFGDAALNTNASSTSTWNSDFKAVWHLADGSTLKLTDSTSNANTLVTSSSAPTATAGQIDGGANFVAASSQYLAKTTMSIGANNISLSAWVYSTNFVNNMMVLEQQAVNAQWELFFSGGSVLLRGGGTGNTLSTTAPSNSNWHHVAGTINGTSGALYIDGVATTGTVDAFTDAAHDVFISSFDGSNFFFDGKIDEARISKIARPADWITAEFNSQVNPGAFLSHNFQAVGGATGGGPLIRNGELVHGSLIRGGRIAA